MLLVWKKSKKAFIKMRVAKGYEDPHYYLDVYTKDKQGNIEYIVKHYIVGIIGLSQDCDYELNDKIRLRFTKIHSTWLDFDGNIRAIANILLLTK